MFTAIAFVLIGNVTQEALPGMWPAISQRFQSPIIEHVVTGQMIARIDPRDDQTALEPAESQVVAAQGSVRDVDAQMNAQQAQINANQAQVDQVQANLKLAQVTWGRDKPLVHLGWATG